MLNTVLQKKVSGRISYKEKAIRPRFARPRRGPQRCCAPQQVGSRLPPPIPPLPTSRPARHSAGGRCTGGSSLIFLVILLNGQQNLNKKIDHLKIKNMRKK